MQADFDKFVRRTHGVELAAGGGEGESLAGGDAQNRLSPGRHIELERAHPGLLRAGIEVEAGIELHRAERGQTELV